MPHRLKKNIEPPILAIDQMEYYFCHYYVKFLLEQNLIRLDYTDYLIDFLERNLFPIILAPLTQRGRDLLEYIVSLEESLFPKDECIFLIEHYLHINNLENLTYQKLKKAEKFKEKLLTNQ